MLPPEKRGLLTPGETAGSNREAADPDAWFPDGPEEGGTR